MRFIVCILLLICCTCYGRSSSIGDNVHRSQDNKTQISGFPNPAKKDSLEQKKWLADRHLQLGILYNENGLYKESIDCFQKADSLYLLINDTDYHSYALVRLYNAYHVIGNKKQYDKIREKLLSYNKELTFNNLEIAQIVTSQLGKFYREDGNYEKALNAYTNSFKSSKSFYGEGNPKTFPICYELTSIYLQIEDLKGASEYIEYLKNICESHPENREDYISYILLHCELLKQLGHIGHAISLLEDNKVNIDSIDNPELKSLFYSSLGDLYADIGDFKQALTLEILSQSLCEEATGKESVQYAHGLLNLSELYALNNNDSEALQSTLKAIEIIRAKYGIDHPEYYKCLCKLAERYIYTNNEKSKELRKECLILSKKIYGENSIEYAENLIYSIDLSLNPSNEDIEAFLKALEIRRTLGRNFDQHYLSYLNWYSVLLFLKQDWESLLITSNEILKCTREFIRLNFQELSSSQREKLWNTVKNALNGLESYAAQYSQYAVEHSDYSLVNDFGKIAYNTRLIKKGLLLESNKRLSDLIMASSDTNVTQIYHHIEIIKKRLTNSDLNNQDILSLKAQLFSMERELIQRVAPNGEFVDFLSVEWENVQAALTSNEVAIEFFSYPAQDKIQYGAVILSNDSYPLACGLFCEDELTKFTNSDETSFDYNNPNLYRTIWAVLETFSVVRDAQTIYFSADNILNTVAIENLMDFDGLRANEKRRLYRLSSTREIVTKRPNNSIEFSAILYGGLNYDAPLDSLTESSSKSSAITSYKFSQHSHMRSSRGTYDYLPGTLNEINYISHVIKSAKLELRSGVEGSEDSFIALSEASPSIIHLATHGFFYEPEDIEDKLSEDPTKYSFLNIQNLEEVSAETQAMRGSGILFSGANHALKGISIPANIPDGILTAEELSNLNLQQTEFVVLSACETGLGTTTEEGVWGLQRGFKLAGVKSLLMSLWKVDDKVTSKMMQYFYENISNGLNKIHALQEAQKKMRDNPETSQPYFWAGWILLDGLDY